MSLRGVLGGRGPAGTHGPPSPGRSRATAQSSAVDVRGSGHSGLHLRSDLLAHYMQTAEEPPQDLRWER